MSCTHTKGSRLIRPGILECNVNHTRVFEMGLVVACLGLACQGPQKADGLEEVCGEGLEALKPLYLGMPREDAKQAVPASEIFYLMNHSAQLREGLKGKLSGELEVALAFGREDEVCCIAVYDPRIKIDGWVRGGSTYGQVKARYPTAREFVLPGYARFIEIIPGAYAAFLKGMDQDYEMDGEDEVSWLDFRAEGYRL